MRGEDLLLSGKFGHWVPLSLDDGSGKLPEAQLVFDVTSVGPANDGGEVFSFVATEVEPLVAGAYLARGTLRRDDREQPAQAVLQAPATHSPFALVTFQIDPATFPELWSELEARVANDQVPEGEVRPWAWPQAPTLAAA